MTAMTVAPVITIDGLSASGKGTLASRLAHYLSWHLLDSGALYRAFAFGFVQDRLQHHVNDYRTVIERLRIDYFPDETGTHQLRLFYSDRLIHHIIREECWGKMASELAIIPAVREVLFALQRQARCLPGLVADGRDMGSVIFPDAVLKFYLEADCELRARRRFNQLKGKGINVSLGEIHRELIERDRRDQERAHAPARFNKDMILIDTTTLSIEQVFRVILDQVNVAITIK